jgi:hypothetical protein
MEHDMTARALDEHDFARIRMELDRGAEMFDNPDTYRSGLDDALDAVLETMFPQHDLVPTRRPRRKRML